LLAWVGLLENLTPGFEIASANGERIQSGMYMEQISQTTRQAVPTPDIQRLTRLVVWQELRGASLTKESSTELMQGLSVPCQGAIVTELEVGKFG
jgi:hypothetical protein